MSDPAVLHDAALAIGNRIDAEIKAAMAALVRAQVDADES